MGAEGGDWEDDCVQVICKPGRIMMNRGARSRGMGRIKWESGASNRRDWKRGAAGSTPLCRCLPASQAPSPSADAFLHYRTSKVRALRAARLERLVWELVSGDSQQDPSFVPAFLATYRAFVPTDRVLGLLLPPPPPPLPPWSVSMGNFEFPPQTLTQTLSNLEARNPLTPHPSS